MAVDSDLAPSQVNRHTAFALPKLVDRWLIAANPRFPLIRFPSCFWVACGAASNIQKLRSSRFRQRPDRMRGICFGCA
jgi:hypothetical protein